MGFGEYPPEFNPRIHGPYNPSRYYGKADMPIGEVKLGEMGSWLSRRNYSPRAMAAGISRGFWRWNLKYAHAKNTGIAPLIQVTAVLATAYYFFGYRAHANHRHAKYH